MTLRAPSMFGLLGIRLDDGCESRRLAASGIPRIRAAAIDGNHHQESRLGRWASGEQQLAKMKRQGHWPDGRPIGRGYPQPCLQPKYAEMIAAGIKTVEGRPGGGFLGSGARHLAVDDYINFQVNGGRRLVVRVMAVHKYASFDAMISALGVDSLLPDFRGSDQEAAMLYRSFGNLRGSYADLGG